MVKILDNIIKIFNNILDQMYVGTAMALRSMGYSNDRINDALDVLFNGNFKLLWTRFKQNRLKR